MDGQPVLKRKVRVAHPGICGRVVPLQLCDQRRQPIREVLQEREHLCRREQVFHHHEAHEVQAKVTGGRGGFYRGAQPAHVGCQAVLAWLVHTAMPSRLAGPAGGGLSLDKAS